MDDDNEELTKRLHEVLDVIGASEYTREKYWEGAMLYEIVRTFESYIYSKTPYKKSFYQAGSRCEGTTTPDFDSDRDVIQCYDETPVVEKLDESQQNGCSFLILTDESTEPGYVRHQIIKDKCPLTVGMCDISEYRCFIDNEDRVCAINYPSHVGANVYRNGPANTSPADNYHFQFDLVFAFRCKQIPKSANSWLHRIRKYDWPSQKQLKAMGSYGCFCVGVGHPHSNNKSSEWRISFTLQERDLMSSLNETQHKCYILLKMIKKDIIEPKARESISSYHCKTCLFYTIENSQRHFWTNDKLILCVQQCLKRLFIWVEAKNCPNYFIPEENMFDKLCPLTLKKTATVLNDILERDIMFLYSLTCDNVGELLKSGLFGDTLVCSLANTSTTHHPRHFVCYTITEYIYSLRNWLMRQMSVTSNTNTGYMNEVMQLLLYLQHTNHVTDHLTKDVRMALDSIIPHIQLQYKQCMLVQDLSQGNVSDLRYMTNSSIIPAASDFDLISSKLSEASLYIQCEQLQEECQRILVSCGKTLHLSVQSVCSCSSRIHGINLALAIKMRFTDMSSRQFRQHFTTGCMVFHPSQRSLVHEALQYEMYRNVFTQTESELQKMEQDFWLNWITVDSKIYLYFLQYLLYSKTKQQKEKETVFLKLALVLNTDDNLGHRETALNLIGWIYLQEKELQLSWVCFCLSWRNRQFKNAAKWHMLVLLREIMKGFGLA